MAVARTRCVTLIGVGGHVVEVEADVGRGVPGMHLIGLLDTALSEARGRVRSAVINSGFAWPDARITVSLCPASRSSILSRRAQRVAETSSDRSTPRHDRDRKSVV